MGFKEQKESGKRKINEKGNEAKTAEGKRRKMLLKYSQIFSVYIGSLLGSVCK